jgi:hypothetical protein
VAGYKDYVLEFKLGDGTMHTIPFRIPLGENGGYYTPEIEQISDTEIKISYTPSMADMPTIKPAVIKIPGSGGNVDYGAENAGKLLYVGADGFATVLALGAGLAIVDGVLTITSQVVTSAICGQAVCGKAICGGA